MDKKEKLLTEWIELLRENNVLVWKGGTGEGKVK